MQPKNKHKLAQLLNIVQKQFIFIFKNTKKIKTLSTNEDIVT